MDKASKAILAKKIEFEISQLDEHIAKSLVLIQICAVREPDYVETCAAGSILQSFYNGIENVLLIIAKHVDGAVPRSEKWHSALLSAMCVATDGRPAVFSERMRTSLADYLHFRHFFRHSYGYAMRWEKFSHLFVGLENHWNVAKAELKDFLARL